MRMLQEAEAVSAVVVGIAVVELAVVLAVV